LKNDNHTLEERVQKLEEELSKQVSLNKELIKKMQYIEVQTMSQQQQQKKNTRVKNATHFH